MDFGFFGKVFDFDRDGHLDGFERAADFATFMSIMKEAEEQGNDQSDDIFLAGPDRDELELMDDWDRRETLEDAGLDPDDYDF